MAAAAETWTVHTDVFDGPLDLLLYLVRRDGIDLKNLQVHRIADAYLSYLDRMREVHLGVAAEYLVMAATLVWLKSLELLPRKPTLVEDEEEEGEDPRAALARRLAEYARYRDAADHLEERPWVGREVFVREPTPVDDGTRPVESPIDAFGLLEIYHDLLTRDVEPEPVHTVQTAQLSVEDACRRVLSWLDRGRGELGALLRVIPTRAERVVTFVAVLEMARLGWVEVTQHQHLGPVVLASHVAADVDLTRITGRVEEAASA